MDRQNKLHKELHEFLHGVHMPLWSKLLYPLLDIERYQKRLVDSNCVARTLEKEYVLLILKKTNKQTCIQTLQRNNAPRLVKSLQGILRPVNHLFLGFYLNGSHAVGDPVKGWSDVDCVAIVKNEAMSAVNLLRLRRVFINLLGLFNSIDPYQHHGVFIITEKDLSAYPLIYFPPEVFAHSFAVLGNCSIVFHERSSTQELRDTFDEACRYLAKPMGRKATAIKSYIHTITLLPSLFYELHGRRELSFKRDAIRAFVKEFPKTKGLFDEVAMIRYSWKKKPSGIITFFSRLNPFFAHGFYKKCRTKPPIKIRKRFIESQTRVMLELIR